MNDLISRQAAIDAIMGEPTDAHYPNWYAERLEHLPSAQPDRELIEQLRWERDIAIQQLKDLGYGLGEKPRTDDTISRQAAIEATWFEPSYTYPLNVLTEVRDRLKALPSAQPERKWTSCSNPPKHHKDVIVRGIEAIGNVTVYKVMQWDVDTWRPKNYAPSVMWEEWSEI